MKNKKKMDEAATTVIGGLHANEGCNVTQRASVPMSVLQAAQRLAPDEASVAVVGSMLIATAERGELKATATTPVVFPLLSTFPLGGGEQTFNREQNTRRAQALRKSVPKTINGGSQVDFEEVCLWWASTNRPVPAPALALLCDETRSQLSKGKERSEGAQTEANKKVLRVLGLFAELVVQHLPSRLRHEDGSLNEAQTVEAMLERVSNGDDVGPWGLGKTTLRTVLADARQAMRGVTLGTAKKRPE